MRIRIRKRALAKITAWLAAIVVLFASFAPAFAQVVAQVVARANATPTLSIVLCTPHGPRAIDEGTGIDGQSPSGQTSLSGFEHCPFCFTQAISHALPAAEAVHLAIVPAVVPIARVSIRPVTVHAGTVGQPRAPPLLASLEAL